MVLAYTTCAYDIIRDRATLTWILFRLIGTSIVSAVRESGDSELAAITCTLEIRCDETRTLIFAVEHPTELG